MDLYTEYSPELKWFIMEAVSYLLHHNFLFNSKLYIQKQGASMGDRFSPTYANLYMGWWEVLHIYNADNPHRNNILLYFRYSDDLIFIIK